MSMQAVFFKGTVKDEKRQALFDAIRAATGGPYVHSALLFMTDGVMGEATDQTPAGVRYRYFPYLPAQSWDFVDLDPFKYPEMAARQWFDLHLGEPYDYAGAERCLPGGAGLKQDPNAWYCSEAVMAALKLPGEHVSDSNSLYRMLTGT